MPRHIDTFRIAFSSAVESGKVMANDTVERFNKACFGLGANMLFGNAIFLVCKAIVTGGNLDIKSLCQPHRHRLIRLKVSGFRYFKINHFSSDSVHSKPDIDAVLFFWT